MGCKDISITIFHCLLILMLSILIYTTYTDMRLCIFFEKTEGFFLRIQEDLDRRGHHNDC